MTVESSLTDDWQWYGAEGEEPENYFIVEASREAAIQACRDHGYDVFTVLEARHGTMQQCLPDGGSFLEYMSEQADNNGLFGDDYMEIKADTREAEAVLEVLLAAWYRQYAHIFPTPWAFAETRNEETIFDKVEVEFAIELVKDTSNGAD